MERDRKSQDDSEDIGFDIFVPELRFSAKNYNVNSSCKKKLLFAVLQKKLAVRDAIAVNLHLTHALWNPETN